MSSGVKQLKKQLDVVHNALKMADAIKYVKLPLILVGMKVKACTYPSLLVTDFRFTGADISIHTEWVDKAYAYSLISVMKMWVLVTVCD